MASHQVFARTIKKNDPAKSYLVIGHMSPMMGWWGERYSIEDLAPITSNQWLPELACFAHYKQSIPWRSDVFGFLGNRTDEQDSIYVWMAYHTCMMEA